MSEEPKSSESGFPDLMQEELETLRQALPKYEIEHGVGAHWFIKLGEKSTVSLCYRGEESSWVVELYDPYVHDVQQQFESIKKTVNRAHKKDRKKQEKQKRERRRKNGEQFAQILALELGKHFHEDIATVAAAEIARRKFMDEWSSLTVVLQAVKTVESSKNFPMILHAAEVEYLKS